MLAAAEVNGVAGDCQAHSLADGLIRIIYRAVIAVTAGRGNEILGAERGADYQNGPQNRQENLF